MKCTHIPIAQTKPVLGDEWDEPAAELAQALANPVKKRNRERFGMSRELRSALTQFVRIGHSFEKANQFRRDYPNFFPAEFWDSGSETPEIPIKELRTPIRFWKVWQRLLLDAWHADFHPDLVIQLNSAPLADPVMVELPDRLPPKFEFREPQISVELPTREKLEKLKKLRCIEIQPVHDFQRAVAAMGASPWRAKFCSKCGQPFAADKPQRDYCSDACRKEVHRLAWQERWEKYGKKWRQKQRTRRAKRRRAAG